MKQRRDVDRLTDKITDSVRHEAIAQLEEKITTQDHKIKEQQRNVEIEFKELKAKLRIDEEKAEREKQAQVKKFALDLEKIRLEISEKKRLQSKLPDFQITKFQGTHLD